MFRYLNRLHYNFISWFKYAYKTFRDDYGFIMSCVVLASACSYFPYYVHKNADQFGPPLMAFSGKVPGDLETTTEVAQTKLSATRFRLLRAEVNGSGPTIVPEEIFDAIATASISLDTSIDPVTTASIDPVTTGSINPTRRVPLKVETQADRNNLGQKRSPGQAGARNVNTRKANTGKVNTQDLGFTLIFASSGHALIQDGEDIMPVSRGSRLPDGSTVRSVRLRDGQWQLVTSTNAILAVTN